MRDTLGVIFFIVGVGAVFFVFILPILYVLLSALFAVV